MRIGNRHQIEQLLKLRQRRLYLLEQRAAVLGNNSPPELIIEIQDLQQAISELLIQLEQEKETREFTNSVSIQEKTAGTIYSSFNKQFWLFLIGMAIIGMLIVFGFVWTNLRAKGNLLYPNTETTSIPILTPDIITSTSIAVTHSLPTTTPLSVNIVPTEIPTPATAKQVAIATATTLQAVARIRLDPTNGSLLPNDPTGVSIRRTSVNLKNFMVSCRFINAYEISDGSWSYGYYFRATSQHGYYITVSGSSSDSSYSIREYFAGNPNNDDVGSGTLHNLKLLKGDSNTVKLIVQDKEIFLYINNDYIDTIDLRSEPDSGSISLGVNFYTGDKRNTPINYEDFTIWTLDF